MLNLLTKLYLAQTSSQTPFPSTQTPAGSRIYKLLNPLGEGVTSFSQIINSVAKYLTIYIAPPIVTIMILIAGFYFLTAGENPERVKTARQIILWTVIGYAIILISWGVTSIITELLGGGIETMPVSPEQEWWGIKMRT
jgi:hypothetical protein